MQLKSKILRKSLEKKMKVYSQIPMTKVQEAKLRRRRIWEFRLKNQVEVDFAKMYKFSQHNEDAPSAEQEFKDFLKGKKHEKCNLLTDHTLLKAQPASSSFSYNSWDHVSPSVSKITRFKVFFALKNVQIVCHVLNLIKANFTQRIMKK